MQPKQPKQSSGNGRRMSGKVVSTAMQKSVVVEIENYFVHPMYGKRIRRTKRIIAHNELEDVKTGSVVWISEVKPISKNKHFKVTAIV